MAIDSIALREVPASLQSRPQWLVWKFEPGEKKPRKMPYYASGARRSGTQGSDADRAKLMPFEAALAAAIIMKMDGIGFAFLPDDGLIGIDIDGAIDLESGEISERAQSIISACDSYTEFSPSRTGVHIIVAGKIEASFKSNDIGVEVFCNAQYFTFTGARWPGSPVEVNAIGEAVLRRLKKTVDVAKDKDKGGKRASAPPPPDTNERAKIEAALAFISPDLGYDEWIQVGMAIHAALGEGGFAVWDYWSAKGSKYAGGKAMASHWKSFKPGGRVTAGTLFKLAKDHGYKPPRAVRPTPPQGDSREQTRTRKPSQGEKTQMSADGAVVDAPESENTPNRATADEFDPAGFWRPAAPDFLHETDKGGVKPLLHNLMLILRDHPAWSGVLGFDRYSELIMAVRPPPWQGDKPFIRHEWSEEDDYRLRHWLSTYFFEAKEKDVLQAVTLIAHRHAFHPLIERFEATPWDGNSRIKTWLMEYLGACKGKRFTRLPQEEQDRTLRYAELAGFKWLVGAVARVYWAAQPGAVTGSQMDTMLILEGEQGIMKSSALRVLGGAFFTDEKLDFGNKDSLMILQGRHIIEMAELEGLNKSESSATKNFLTKREDLFRLPYGRKLVKKPRRCAFAGTVNHESYLKDDSGNRRYWPIYCTAIDLERLKADVDQLWAEALHWYREGAKWWVLPDERQLFEFEQDKRYQEDAWQEPVEDYCIGKNTVTTGELLADALKIEKARWDKMSQMRVGSIMRRMGWSRARATISGFQTYVYVRPGSEDDAPDGVRKGDDATF